MHNVYFSMIPFAHLSLSCSSSIIILQGHFSAVTSLSLSPDGWLLLSGGRDKVGGGEYFKVQGFRS